MNAVDTNVFVYSLDRHEPVKQLKAQQLLRQLQSAAEPTVVPWQVVGEFVQRLRRWMDQGQLTTAEFLQHVQAFRQMFPVVLPVISVLDRALDLAARYSLAHWDSMILGACQAANVDKLYTEDMGSPTMIDGIQLLNPFS